jgi:hypothetical protein
LVSRKATLNNYALVWYLAKRIFLSMVKIRIWVNKINAKLMQSTEKLKISLNFITHQNLLPKSVENPIFYNEIASFLLTAAIRLKTKIMEYSVEFRVVIKEGPLTTSNQLLSPYTVALRLR